MNTIFQLSKYALQELKDSYNEHEISALCHIIYSAILHFTNIDIHLRKNEILTESFVKKFQDIVGQLKAGRPIQYILGETEFDGRKFRVTPATLIPRPETAELVDWVKTELQPGLRVLDIGTGSGCIAISIALHCPEVSVTAIDLSPEALEVARQNAERHRANVDFRLRDILHYENDSWPAFGLIVSNPPYVRESEKKDMEPRVLAYEPHQALFVPDDDPLLFYRSIAAFGQQYLSPGGKLFLEINEALGHETVALLKHYEYRDIELRQDFYEKARKIKARKK